MMGRWGLGLSGDPGSKFALHVCLLEVLMISGFALITAHCAARSFVPACDYRIVAGDQITLVACLVLHAAA